jgi:hypothetical protein
MSGEGAARARRIATRLAAVAAAVLVLLLLAAIAVYLGRLDLARQAALAWIRNQGVEGEVQLQALGPTGLKAKVRIGPADHPDLTVEEADVAYSLDSFVRGKGLNVSAVRLNRPVLNASWRGGRLGLGQVDRLLAALKPQPGAPPTPPPRIEVRSGLVRLATDYGTAAISADADLDQGRLDRLDASLAPTTLHLGQATAQLGSGVVRATRSGDRLRLGAQVQAGALSAEQGSASGAEMTLQADLSYAALSDGRLDGRIAGQASVAKAGAGDLAVKGLKLDVQAPRLLVAPGAGTGSGGFHLRAAVAQLTQADLRLEGLSSEGSGRLSLDKAGVAAAFTGGLTGQGASSSLGPEAADDAPVMAAVKRGLQRFRFAVGKAELSMDHRRASGRLLAPAQATFASGGVLDVKPVGRDGYSVTLAGGALPYAHADVRRVDFTAGGGAVAQTGVTAAFSLGLLDQAQIKADGRLTVRDGTAAFAASSCADVAVKRLDFGDNSAVDLVNKLCPVREPMLTAAAGRWSIAGEAREASARVPSFEAGLSGGSGSLRLRGAGQDVSAEFVVDEVKVTDQAKPLRFHPVIASGRATLVKDLFSGAADIKTPMGLQLAHADFHDEVMAMKGGMTISAPAVTFARGALQPTQLSPLTAALGEPASGKVAFQGRFDWVGDKTSSSGRLSAENLSFRGPAGAVTGFSGVMDFTSLAPLAGASVGPLKADRIAGVVALTDASAVVKVDNEKATVTEGQGSVGGGKVRITATASLSADQAGQTVTGQVTLDGVQVHDLVASSPLSDKVSMTAQISGALPFRVTAGKLRIAGGAAKSDGPGRLSINRATFNPGGAASGPATRDNLTTFGYQAMENLAFQTLDATIGSQADGKLRMVFHIAGKYDPPTRKELRLTWRDVIARDVLNRPMPLPSNTGVNLTLDTTLNLDNLIESKGAVERQLGSAPVQPPAATLGVDTAKGPP